MQRRLVVAHSLIQPSIVAHGVACNASVILPFATQYKYVVSRFARAVQACYHTFAHSVKCVLPTSVRAVQVCCLPFDVQRRHVVSRFAHCEGMLPYLLSIGKACSVHVCACSASRLSLSSRTKQVCCLTFRAQRRYASTRLLIPPSVLCSTLRAQCKYVVSRFVLKAGRLSHDSRTVQVGRITFAHSTKHVPLTVAHPVQECCFSFHTQ